MKILIKLLAVIGSLSWTVIDPQYYTALWNLVAILLWVYTLMLEYELWHKNNPVQE